jgi:hypothetical protein
MFRMKRTAALGVVLIGMLAVPAIASAGTLYVSHSATPTGNDKNCSTAAYSTVQSAVDATKKGGDVYLCGTTPYVEDVVIQQQLNLGGDPGAAIQASSTPPATTFFSSQGQETPNSVVTLIGNINVQIKGLTVEGPFANSGCSGDDFGVLQVSSGKPGQLQMQNDKVLNIGAADAGLGGCQYGVAIQIGREYWPDAADANYQTPDYTGNAQIQTTTVSGYQKNGITVDGPGSQAQIQSSNIDGGGQNAIIARNGIQISRGATAQVHNSTINNNEYTGPGSFASATGVLVFGGCGDPLSTNVQVHDNTLTNNDSGVVLANYTPDPNCVASATSPTNNQVHDNVIAKNDGITNNSPFTDQFGNNYTGYQVGVADTGNNDQIHDNNISSTDGAFGPLVTPPGKFLAPIDVQTYPPIDSQVHGNKYNTNPTNPPYPGEPGAPQ